MVICLFNVPDLAARNNKYLKYEFLAYSKLTLLIFSIGHMVETMDKLITNRSIPKMRLKK